MEDDFVIGEEKVNLLHGFFSYLPESIIRDVLNRPDVAGNVELASEALGMLMEFSEADHGSVNYVEYDIDDSVKGTMEDICTKKIEYDPDDAAEDWRSDDDHAENEQDDTSGDWGKDDYDAEYKQKKQDETDGDWGIDDYKSSKDDYYETDKFQVVRQRMTDELPGLHENESVQAKEHLKCKDEIVADDEWKSFHSKMDVNQSSEAATNKRSLVTRIDREKIPLAPNEGNSLSRELRTESKETLKHAKVEKVPQYTSTQFSDSDDEDVESWLESTYGHNKNTTEEKIERSTVSQTTCRSIESFFEHSKPDSRSNNPDVVEAVDSEKVEKSRILEADTPSRSHDQRRSVSICEKTTGVVNETLRGKHIPLSCQDWNKSELNHDRKEPVQNTNNDLLQMSFTTEPTKDETRQQSPRRNLPQPRSSCAAKQSDVEKHVTIETGEASVKTKPKRRNRRKRGSEATPLVEVPKSNLVDGFASNRDQLSTHGNQKDSNHTRLFEEKRILVSGLSEKTTPDALLNYMELMTGVDVERTTFLGQGRAVVDTSESPEFEKVERKVNSRTLEGMQLSVERIKVCDSIFVNGLSPQVTKDTILLYFENVRRSGGGDVKAVTLYKDTKCAIVCFEDVQVIDNVVGKEHSLEGKQVSIEKYYPQISPSKISSSPSDTSSSPNNSTETENSRKQENRDISPERPNVSTEVDDHIMQFIMSGRHCKELKGKLSDLKAEIEWSPGSNKAKIWKKANSGYVKKWTNSCQTVVCEFLDRFEKFYVPLEGLAAAVIKDAVQRLTEKLPKDKALCKRNENKPEIAVVCLENEKEIVSKSVKEFLDIIQKEEVRKTYKKETVKNISHEHVLLLEQIGFVEEMKSKHSELEVILDTEKRELYFEGPREQFTDSKIRYFHIMNTIAEETFTLPSTIFKNIVTNESGKKYFQAKLAREKIYAKFVEEKGNAIKIVATNSTACQKAEECLSESLNQVNVSFQTHDTFIFDSKKWRKLAKDLQEEQLLEICTEISRKRIAIHGITEAVVSAKKQIEDFIDKERIRSESQQISKGLMRFLSDQFSEKLKGIENRSKVDHLSLKIHQTKQALVMAGTQQGLKNCRECLQDLFASVVEESKEYSSPGLANLLLGEKGQRNIKLMEIEKKVVIETSKRVKNDMLDTRRDEVDSIKREAEKLMEERKRSREEVRLKSLDGQTTGCIYDLCNFTTVEGLKVVWKYGCIEKERADILVNSATSNLNKLTACGRALWAVGGQGFADACKPHTNIPEGDIVCTDSGNLPSQFVFHAVCCHWDNGKGRAEKLLRGLVNKILSKCVEHRVASVAIPTVGTGQHGFPEAVVFRVFKEEIQSFSAANHYQNFLTEIRVIVFKSNPRPSVQSVISQPFQRVLSAVKSVIANSGVVSFGAVRVSLYEGDITQQPTSVDAIINVLDSSLQLQNGGGVCKSIFRVGGQTIQQQLDAVVGKPRGSVIRTNAGSMTNTSQILHFVPTSTNAPDLQRAIEKCMYEAKTYGLVSVSIPAIGTASFGISGRSSAELILNAAKNFSSASYKLDVNIVVFQKNMISDFETVIREQAQGYTKPIQQSQAAQSPNVPSISPAQYHRKRAKTPRKHVSLKTGTAKEIIVLDLFASSQQDIDTSLEEVDKFIKEHTTTKKIEHEKVFEVLVKHWSEAEDLARDHDVCITCSKSPPVAAIEGIIANVSDCKDELSQLITTHVEEERKSSQVEFISKNVQWYYFEGSRSVLYDKELNAAIEVAYMEGEETLEIIKNGEKWEVNVIAKTEKNQRSGQVGAITRKQVGDSGSDISLPAHWDPQPQGQVVHLVSLSQSSAEYQQVYNHFTSKGGRASQIINIERIQNPGLYKAYLAKKESMNGTDNEMQLFHGTNSNNTQSINANNFNRSFAGINGVMYGNGVYFARDASYSLRYAQRGSSGYCQMYVARVLVGRYAVGTRGMKVPPSRNDPANPGVLYDSLVNNVSNPSIFVIFIDHQCYPEYLITYT